MFLDSIRLPLNMSARRSAPSQIVAVNSRTRSHSLSCKPPEDRMCSSIHVLISAGTEFVGIALAGAARPGLFSQTFLSERPHPCFMDWILTNSASVEISHCGGGTHSFIGSGKKTLVFSASAVFVMMVARSLSITTKWALALIKNRSRLVQRCPKFIHFFRCRPWLPKLVPLCPWWQEPSRQSPGKTTILTSSSSELRLGAQLGLLEDSQSTELPLAATARMVDDDPRS